MSNFREVVGILGHFWKFEKNFKLLEHKHIIYNFEAGDLEIPNIQNVSDSPINSLSDDV